MAIEPQSVESLENLPDREAGYMLLAVVVMVALILIALAVAAPVVAKNLQREKELESQHRANQYVRAIRLFYRKTHAYPPSIKALESTNNVRFLRQQYVDPLTGKSDWKIIHQGEQQTKIHVFFGKELAEAVVGMGAAQANPLAANGGTSALGGSPGGNTNALNMNFSSSPNSGASGATGVSGATGSAFGSTGSTGSTGSGTGMFGDSTGGVIVGVSTARSGTSITNPNQQVSYDTWEFWYDPRIEILRQSVNITGGGISSGAAASTGTSASSFGMNLNGTPNGATGSTGASGATGATGSTSPSGGGLFH